MEIGHGHKILWRLQELDLRTLFHCFFRNNTRRKSLVHTTPWCVLSKQTQKNQSGVWWQLLNSTNRDLVSGPDLTNQFIGILFVFICMHAEEYTSFLSLPFLNLKFRFNSIIYIHMVRTRSQLSISKEELIFTSLLMLQTYLLRYLILAVVSMIFWDDMKFFLQS